MSFPYINVLMIRHGQARAADGSYGPDTLLSELGHRQAGETAEKIFTQHNLSAIYTSPFPRALQTAQPLVDRLALEPLVDERLEEFQLPTQNSVDAQPDVVIWQPTHRGSPDSETLDEFSARVVQFMLMLCEHHNEETVAVYTHAGVIDAAARWAFGLPTDSIWQHDLPIANASITELKIWPQGRVKAGAPLYVEFVQVGNTDHLGGLASEM
ncbi:MAG: histidine phosphatase family protein [Pseudomonadota bacterium]